MRNVKLKMLSAVLIVAMLLSFLNACDTSMENLIDKSNQWADDNQDVMWGDGSDDVWDNTTDIEY